jgi:hypothetical protein
MFLLFGVFGVEVGMVVCLGVFGGVMLFFGLINGYLLFIMFYSDYRKNRVILIYIMIILLIFLS